jgi:tRNA (guanine9-N1)-methyltransferase
MQAKFEAARPEKRAAERARRRDRAHYLSEGYAAGTLSPEDAALVERQREQKRARKLASRGADSASVFPAGVIVDLEFDDLMTDQEITSMHSQLGYVYSCNRTAARPFAAVLHTGFSPVNAPRLWSKMGKAQWHRWARMWFTAEGVGEVGKRLGKAPEEVEELDTPAPAEAPAASTSEVSPDTPYGELVQHLATSLPSTIPPTHKLVYLSADAEEELSTLAEDEVYVLGGIVDRNRHKVSTTEHYSSLFALLTRLQMLCQNKAEGLSIRTARLPIGTYLANLPTRKVLTVNQVSDARSSPVTHH